MLVRICCLGLCILATSFASKLAAQEPENRPILNPLVPRPADPAMPVKPVPPMRAIRIPAVPLQAAPMPWAWAGQNAFGAVGLSHLVGVKMKLADEKPQLILMLEAHRIEEREVERQKIEIQERTDTIVVDGKKVERTHSVAVPVKVLDKQRVSKSAGLKPKTIAANEFGYYDLSGKPLSIDEAAKRLTTLTPVFLLDYFDGEVKGLSKIQQQAVSPKCLIITSKKRLRGTVNYNLPTY